VREKSSRWSSGLSEARRRLAEHLEVEGVTADDLVEAGGHGAPDAAIGRSLVDEQSDGIVRSCLLADLPADTPARWSGRLLCPHPATWTRNVASVSDSKSTSISER
jgi:hypothetical protein